MKTNDSPEYKLWSVLFHRGKSQVGVHGNFRNPQDSGESDRVLFHMQRMWLLLTSKRWKCQRRGKGSNRACPRLPYTYSWNRPIRSLKASYICVSQAKTVTARNPPAKLVRLNPYLGALWSHRLETRCSGQSRSTSHSSSCHGSPRSGRSRHSFVVVPCRSHAVQPSFVTLKKFVRN